MTTYIYGAILSSPEQPEDLDVISKAIFTNQNNECPDLSENSSYWIERSLGAITPDIDSGALSWIHGHLVLWVSFDVGKEGPIDKKERKAFLDWMTATHLPYIKLGHLQFPSV